MLASIIKFNIILRQIRIKQWVKNCFVFIPIIVTGNFNDQEYLYKSFIAFIIFSITSSLIYVVNDLKDVERDRLHPIKSQRPIAKGDLSKKSAYILFGILLLIDIFLNIYFPKIILVIILYIVMNLIYTYLIKFVPIFDVTFISLGFVLRVLSGTTATSLDISGWLLSLTFFLSLILAFGKRRGDLENILLKPDFSTTKKYNRFLTTSISICSSLVLTTYLIYVFGTDNFLGNIYFLYASIVPVFLSIMKYNLLLIINPKILSDPTTLFFKDKSINISVLLWVILIIISFYA